MYHLDINELVTQLFFFFFCLLFFAYINIDHDTVECVQGDMLLVNRRLNYT